MNNYISTNYGEIDELAAGSNIATWRLDQVFSRGTASQLLKRKLGRQLSRTTSKVLATWDVRPQGAALEGAAKRGKMNLKNKKI